MSTSDSRKIDRLIRGWKSKTTADHTPSDKKPRQEKTLTRDSGRIRTHTESIKRYLDQK